VFRRWRPNSAERLGQSERKACMGSREAARRSSRGGFVDLWSRIKAMKLPKIVASEIAVVPKSLVDENPKLPDNR
jgi:hypothetical protein